MVKLDTNAAWKEASAIVSANREVLLALGGVFFMLPSLAVAVIAGEPEVIPGMKGDQMMAAMSAFYAHSWWIILVSAACQIVGLMAILTLMRDRSRPTVGEAIRGGLPGMLSYLAVQVLIVVGLSLIGGLLIGVAAVISPVLAAVVVLVLTAAMLFLVFRLILVAPVIAVEGVRNPLTAMIRSWRLTQGNFWRIFSFLLLILILFAVIVGIVMVIVGLILALASSGEPQRIIAAVFSSALGAVGVVYFAGVIAAIHRQLGGPAAADLKATFE
ncbi:glycerophosphoryl diester phosphodiesterase membrane domain-containing protein [Novosphingobium sp. Gsoil 351]|uniref:glycerophosphoryl diester phosphodiesterase membrane domain-containing protein n=1 Tax=Novosphingobium sp. Gsoil 351 TaxID=2675225 RepID=UPI0012B4855E|nr:glycerophosphoryl diester phosphodiesterase membrane domain-containing protein [Novosphingobium sp. Gsoil 351]QGN55955.1 hypothetical protein GKE62_16730 [Novosphingobium sp. Gsoil 351]